MASDFHRPMSWILWGSTFSLSNAIAPEARKDFAAMSEARKPKDSPQARQACRRSSVMVAEANGVKARVGATLKWHKGVASVAPLARR